jgi:hypothetical protein
MIECKCILPQFKHLQPPKWHCFIVFSTFDENGEIVPSFVACNNCGIVHKVIEVCTSTILEKDNVLGLVALDDVKMNLPEKLISILEKSECNLPTYQEVAFILENKLWNTNVILSKETIDGTILLKYLRILGETLWQVSTTQEAVGEP